MNNTIPSIEEYIYSTYILYSVILNGQGSTTVNIMSIPWIHVLNVKFPIDTHSSNVFPLNDEGTTKIMTVVNN
jgi:hypothetical protein